MRYMPINSGSVLHGIWHDLRLRELKDKLEEMHVMYELSHKKGASMSNKKFVSFQDLTLSRNELGLVVVSGLPTGDSTLTVVPPIGSVQTDKIGFNDLSIDERCALWTLVYGQTVSERPTFKPVSVLNHGGIPVKSPKPDKVLIKLLSTTAPADSPQLAEPFGPELRVPPYHPLMRWRLSDALVDAIYASQVNEAFDPKNPLAMLMTANTDLSDRYTVDKHFSCRLPKKNK